MRTVHSIRPGKVIVARKIEVGGALLFSPLVALVTAVPWLATPTSTWGAWVTALFGVGWFGTALWVAMGRRTVQVPVSTAAELVLALPDEGDDTTYRVMLHDRDHVQLLLEHDDPARALLEVRRIQEELGVAVRPGWGLSASALSHPEQSAPARLVPVEVSGPRWQGQARAALASCLGALFIVGVMVFTFSRVAAAATLLGQVLPLLFAMLLGLVGLLLLVMRSRVRVTAAGLRFDTTVLSLEFKELELPAQALGRADAVGSRPDRPQHVVLHTAAGPRSIQLAGSAALLVARAIVAEPRRGGNPNLSWARTARQQRGALEENPC